MKVAKNMDSVFANCTQDELDYDLIFDNDDTIIDFIAGVDESGELVTGPNFDYSKILEEADMLEDQDDTEARDGKVDHKPAPVEGSKDTDLEVGGEVGDGKEVSGEEKSKESEAHDMTKLGSETAQQTAIQKAMEISAKKFADQSNDCCKENAEYEGYEELVEAVVNGFMSEEEIMSEDASQIAINTADYLISECADAEARDGKVDPDNKGNVEGVKSEVIDNQTKGSANGDPIADDCDQEARDGKVTPDKNVEGVANRIIGAAMENTEFLNEFKKPIHAEKVADKAQRLLNRATDSQKVESKINAAKSAMNKAMELKKDSVVPKAAKAATLLQKHIGESASGDIHKDIEDQTLDSGVESMNKDIVPDSVRVNDDSNDIDIKQEASKEVEDSYKDLIGGMKTGLQKLALANAMNESVLEAADAIYEASEGNVEAFDEYVEYQEICEAVIAAMSDEQIKLENASELVIETANYIISERSALRTLKRGVERNQAKNASPEVKTGIKDKITGAATAAGNFIKKHPGRAAGIGAGVAAVGAGATIAAKKISDKKKAAQQNQEEVKENYEYPEYMSLVEAVVASFTEEELMQENASEFACEVADYMIENADDYITNDDDDEDIESIASNNDPKVNLAYDYDDDELIDMVANDAQL